MWTHAEARETRRTGGTPAPRLRHVKPAHPPDVHPAPLGIRDAVRAVSVDPIGQEEDLGAVAGKSRMEIVRGAERDLMRRGDVAGARVDDPEIPVRMPR